MFGWMRELLEIQYEFRERKQRIAEELNAKQYVCSTCEVLKVALERANYEKEQLLREVLKKDNDEPKPSEAPQPLTKPRHMPWAVRRQMLEAEDRERARLLREAAKPQPTEELEKELDVAAREREAEAATKG